jgi:hypothetical protein
MGGSSGRRSAAAGLLALAVAGCSSGVPGPVVGADTERPVQPETELVRFDEVASEAGLGFRHSAFQWETTGDPPAMMGGGLCWLDFDRDGWMDLFVTNTWSNGEWGRWRAEDALPTSHLFANDRGRFTDITDETGTGIETRANGCVAADLDLDGDTDLYVTTERDNVLLWNDDGRFVTDDGAAGVDAYGWHAGAAVGDVNGDGWPDLFVSGYADMNGRLPGATKGFPNTHVAEPDLLFVSRGPDEGGRVSFRDVAEVAGIEPDGAEYGLGATFSDVDGDGDLDLYVANDTQPNRLYLNESVEAATPTGIRFVDRGRAAGVADPNAGMGVAAADYDGDGQPDLVVTNLGEQLHGVFRSESTSPVFVDGRAAMGVPDPGEGQAGWGVVWADVDLDTDLDLVFVHGAIPVTDLVADRESILAYASGASAGSDRFEPVAEIWGLDDVGLVLGRGAAAADYDNDGDVDLAVGTIGGDLTLLRNSGAGGHWLTIAPDPATPGTVATVGLEDGTSLRREIIAGDSYLSSQDPRLHFGLGSFDGAGTVVVTWPDGSRIELDDVQADRILDVAAG